MTNNQNKWSVRITAVFVFLLALQLPVPLMIMGTITALAYFILTLV